MADSPVDTEKVAIRILKALDEADRTAYPVVVQHHLIQTVKAELDAMLGEQPPQPWQPIATAPKDGQILAFEMRDWGPGFGVLPRVFMCSWWKGDSLNSENWTDGTLPAFPTHWLPLPPPPRGET